MILESLSRRGIFSIDENGEGKMKKGVECQIVSADVLHLLRRSVIQLVEIVKKSL